MWNAFLRLVTEVCAVPPPPAATRSGKVVLADAAYLHYRLTLLAIRGLVFLVSFGIAFASLETLAAQDHAHPLPLLLLRVGEWVFGLGFVAFALVAYALLRLDYENRWYVITDRSLRIREGIVIVHDMTLTYANVQNVSVQQGPLQRMFGIADVQVQTAGGGGGGVDPNARSMHTGVLRGLADAAAVQRAVVARMKQGDAGLGDPDDRRPAALPADDLAAVLDELVATARGAREAAAQLRPRAPGRDAEA